MTRLFLLFLTLPALAAEKSKVVDLGKLEIQGTVRGPEVNLIDSDHMDESSARQMMKWQLKSIEKACLRPTPPRQRTGSGGNR